MKQNILIVDDTALNLQLLVSIAKRLENCEAHGFTDPMPSHRSQTNVGILYPPRQRGRPTRLLSYRRLNLTGWNP